MNLTGFQGSPIFLFLFFVLASSSADEAGALDQESTIGLGVETELCEIELYDQERITGKLFLPDAADSQSISAIVIFVPGTGPATYLNKRAKGSETYNYFDQFGMEFAQRNVAMFSFNKRGVTVGEEPPWFDIVDRAKFRKSVPSNEVRDLEAIIDHLKKDARFTDSKIILLGWSEGTVIAPLFAERYPKNADALLLAGYTNENMFDILHYQHSGLGSMLKLNPLFDKNDDAKISAEEYESNDRIPKHYRKTIFMNAKFGLLDANKDGAITAADFKLRMKLRHNLILTKAREKDADWIWDFYFRIPPEWFDEHLKLEANKTRLTRLDLPIFIFHGTHDQNLPVEGVRQIKIRFETLGKTNLQTFIFDDHDHDLNFGQWIRDGQISDGIRKLLDTAESLAKQSRSPSDSDSAPDSNTP